MAFVAAGASREEKQNWLMRPFNWASSVAWLSATFGAVYYWFALADTRVIVIGLVIALAAIAGLLLWGFSRMHRATQ